MAFIRPVDRGYDPAVYPAVLAISSEGLFIPSQVTFHNMAPWSQPTSSCGCDAREWQGWRRRDKEPESAFIFPRHLPINKCMLILPEERARWLPTMVLLLPSSWPWLLVLDGKVIAYLPHLQSLSHWQCVGENKDGHSYEVGLSQFLISMILGGEEVAYKVCIHGLPCLMALFHLVL